MNEIKVLIKKPGEFPVLLTIENSLEALQKIVGGHIETFTLASDLVIICDEEGRIKNKEYCCNVANVDFVGIVVVAGVCEDEFCDLPVTYHELRRLIPGLWRDVR